MSTLTQITVPFHNAELFLVEHNGQPYTPMKPIVDGVGMDWASQFVKLKQRFATTIVEITIVANDGKERLMTCLPVRKLFGWLMTISPNKVKPELRETVIKYQEECDDVLWDYWTKGQAVNPRPKTHKSERTALHEAHALLVTKTKHLNSSQAWKLIHQRFNVNDVADIPYDAIPVAVEYVHHLIALYSNASKPHPSESVAYQNNLQGLAIHMIWVYKWWKEFGDSIRVLSPRMAGAVHDHFIDGMCFAGHFIDKQTRLAIDERTKYSPWHLNYAERSVMDYRNQ